VYKLANPSILTLLGQNASGHQTTFQGVANAMNLNTLSLFIVTCKPHYETGEK